jgi:ribosomal protein S18 acetylase RimI-like enzyme
MSVAPLSCAPMTAATVADARALIAAFLHEDPHYRASAAVYGDGGAVALERALDLFLARPELGFVWLAYVQEEGHELAVAACVVCRAISTSRGTLVAKLDDVTVLPSWQSRGVGGAMLDALRDHLRGEGVSRIDCGCHRANERAWRFYERLGFVALDEERLALLI